MPCYSLGPGTTGTYTKRCSSDKSIAATNQRLLVPIATPPKGLWQPNLDLTNLKLAVFHPISKYSVYSPFSHITDQYNWPFIFLHNAKLLHCDHIIIFCSPLFYFLHFLFTSYASLCTPFLSIPSCHYIFCLFILSIFPPKCAIIFFLPTKVIHHCTHSKHKKYNL